MISRSKRYISIICHIITAALVVGACFMPLAPIKANAAASGTCGDGLHWVLNGGRMTISGKGDMTDYSDDNMPPWNNVKNEITTVTVESGVKTIGELAFIECGSLTNVILSDTVTQIGTRSFKDCAKLRYINLPSSLYVISESAFENCVSLNGIKLEEGVVVIADKAFFRCRSLTSITVPASVNFFGMVVFAYCENLIRVDIRCPIQSLPDWTFYDCKSLIAVSLPDEMTDVGDMAFHNCDNLSSIHYSGEAVETITTQIKSEISGSSDFSGVVNWVVEDTVSGASTENEKRDEKQSVTVTETEEAHITTTLAVKYDIEDLNKIKTTSIDAVINATVTGEEGLNDLSEAIEKVLEERIDAGTNGSTDVVVQLHDTEVTGEWISKYIGKNISIELINEQGASLRLDMKDVEKSSVSSGDVFKFSYDIKELESRKGIESDKVYQIGFSDDSEVNSHVGINLGTGYARHYATLYEKDGSTSKELQNVIIDDNGQASFAVANIDKKTDYYVGVDVSGITFEKATIPKSLSSEYELAEGSLANTKQYTLTGRKSKWGITSGQYILYVALALGFIIVVVSIIMVSMNRMRNKRAVAMGLKPGEKVPKMKDLRKAAEKKAKEDEKSAAEADADKEEKKKK